MTATHVAVIGGGVSGLAAAYRLRCLLGAQAEITVFEQSDRLGGKLRTVEFAGRPCDVGAEAFLARRGEGVELVAELGMADELVHPTQARASVRAGGRTNPLPAHTLMGVPASAEAVRGVLSADALRRVAAEPTLPPIKLRGDVAVGELLRERFGPEVTDRLVDPLLGGVYAGRADALGLRATMPALAGALDGGVGSLVAAAATLVPTPPRQGTARPPVFGTLLRGLGSLVDRLAEASAARVRFGQPVTRLSRTESGYRLEVGSELVDVDGVVLAVPAPSARKLLGEVAPAAASAFDGIELASMAVVSLALPAGAKLPDNSGVLIAAGDRHEDGTPFTAKAFTYSSHKWAHLDGDGPLVIRGSVGRAGEAATLQRDDEDLIRAVRSDLAELTGYTAEPVETAVTRWGGGLPQYAVGHVSRVAVIETAVGTVPGLAVAGACLHGVGVPACIATSQAAAARVAAHLLGRYRRPKGNLDRGTMGEWPA
jgi:protoporphyrinogen/coproporphyrinogen III oxidase